MRVLHGKPGEIISYFFTLQKIVFEFDPLVDLIVKHDEAYDALMTDFFMNSMSLVDEALTQKITEILDLENPEHRKMLVLLVKKFVHSLGFAFLPMRITLFIWDQMIVKVRRNQVEIFFCMAISFFCLKDEISECKNWDHILNTYYGNSKNIDFDMFYQKYLSVFEKMPFYTSIYELPIEKKQLLLTKKQERSGIGSENAIEELKGKEEEPEKIEFRPNVQKSQKSKTFQPKFIAKNIKKEEDNNEFPGYEINEKEMFKNLLIEEKNEDQPMGLLPNLKQFKKDDILQGFEIKNKKN